MSDGIKKDLRQIIVEMTIPKRKFFPILSWLIRFSQWKWSAGQEWSNVPSHSRIRFFDLKHEVWWVYEASGSSVKLVGYDSVMKNTQAIKTYEYYIPPQTKKILVKNINKSIGTGYGYMQLLGLGIVRIFRAIGFKISNPFADGKKTEVCVETVYWVLWDNQDFQSVLSKYNPDTLDLCDLTNILEELKLWV